MSIDIDSQARPASQIVDKAFAPRRKTRLRSARLAVDIYVLTEFLVLHACGLAAAAWHVGYNHGVQNYPQMYIMPLVVLPLLFAILARSRQLYDFQALCSVSATVGRTLSCLFIAFAIVIVMGFALGVANDYSRGWMAIWLVSGAIAVVLMRVAASIILRRAARAGLIQRRTLIVGSPVSVARLREEIDRSAPEIHVVRVYGDRSGYPRNVSQDDRDAIVAFAQREDVDLVLLARGAFADDNLRETLSALSVLPAEVQLFFDFGSGSIPIRGVSRLSNLALLDVQRRPISGWNHLIKLCLDYSVAIVATVLLLPVLLAIAIAIRLDSRGPVFFRQRRHGFNHRIINVWKFRTMRVMEDGDTVVQASRGDSRVTAVGRFLRRTSLDELPQLFNVLRGEMSIVGPRPHALAHNDYYVELLDHYGSRHRVKPGITGWAQINGFRGPTEDPDLMRRRVEYDLEYIEKWSVWMDLKIIALTPFRGLIHPNAL